MSARALRTRESILVALEKLLANREFEDITIAGIAGEAGVAVGSVYSHFEDRNALLPALLDRRFERIEQRIAELEATGKVEGFALTKEAGPDLKAAVEMMVRAAYQQVQTDRGIIRAMLAYRRIDPDLGAERTLLLAERAIAGLRDRLAAYSDEILVKDVAEAALMAQHFLNLVFLDKALFLSPKNLHELVPGDEVRIQAYAVMLHAYLTTPTD